MGKRNTTPRAWSPFVGTERLSVVSGSTGGPLIAPRNLSASGGGEYGSAASFVALVDEARPTPESTRACARNAAVSPLPKVLGRAAPEYHDRSWADGNSSSYGVGSGGGVIATCSCAGSFAALSRK